MPMSTVEVSVEKIMITILFSFLSFRGEDKLGVSRTCTLLAVSVLLIAHLFHVENALTCIINMTCHLIHHSFYANDF